LNGLVEHATLTLGIKEVAMEVASPNGVRLQTVERYISENCNVQVHLLLLKLAKPSPSE
jgi:hypothetical protein